MNAPTALYNGLPVDGDWVASRGLHYGDGVFRTVYLHDGVCVDGERHRARLAADLSRLGLAFSAEAEAQLWDEAARLAQRQGQGVLKVLAWRRAATRGYAPGSSAAERLLIVGPLADEPPTRWTEGVVAIDSPVRLAAPHVLAGAKHLNRIEQVLASRDWPAGVHEALMCDGDGHVICGTRSNVFWIRSGTVRTPHVDRCGVAGVMRERVLEQAAALGLAVQQVVAPRLELDEAEEIFITNALIGIWPLRQLGARVLQAPGTVTRQLMKTLRHPRMR